MKTKLKIVIIAIAALIAITVLVMPIYPMKAVFDDGPPDYNFTEKEIDEADIHSFIRTLDRYGVRYRKSENQILVPLNLYLNKELRWNYTTKSLETEQDAAE